MYVINPVHCDCGVIIYHDKIDDDDEAICWKRGTRYVVTV